MTQSNQPKEGLLGTFLYRGWPGELALIVAVVFRLSLVFTGVDFCIRWNLYWAVMAMFITGMFFSAIYDSVTYRRLGNQPTPVKRTAPNQETYSQPAWSPWRFIAWAALLAGLIIFFCPPA